MQSLHTGSQPSGLRWRSIVPVVILLILVVTLIVLVVLTGRDPQVRTLEPLVASPGDTVEITGKQFRETPGTIVLAGVELPQSAVREWSPERIDFVVPTGADSGLLFVMTDRGTSNGVLLQMATSVPRSRNVGSQPGAPAISRLEESVANIGAILIIWGDNFGTQRRDSRVVFSAPVDGGALSPRPESVSYPLWTDEEIHVRVPEDAVSGFVTVQTPWGQSNPMRLRIERPAGELVAGRRTELVVRYGASVQVATVVTDEASAPGSRDVILWLSRLPSGLNQSNIRYLTGAERLLGDGLSPVRFESVGEAIDAGVTLVAAVDRYETQLTVDTARISPSYEGQSGFFEYYTRATPMLPARDERFAPVATTIRRNRANPYLIARAGYDWTIDHLDYALYLDDRGAIAGLERGSGDDLTYASLFVTLLRAARIPSRLVGGILVSGQDEAYSHFWGEFFVTGIGWIPVDPALGDGGFPAAFPQPEDPREFYFGNLDARRLAFEYGDDDNGPLLRDGAQVKPQDPYTAQQRYIEVGSSLEAIQIEWSVPEVVGMRRW